MTTTLTAAKKTAVKVILKDANTIRIVWEYRINGELSPIQRCWIRLGTGEDSENVEWKHRYELRDGFLNGHIEVDLKKSDLPTTKEGEKVYGQIQFEPVFVLELDENGELKEHKNHEHETLLSPVFKLSE